MNPNQTPSTTALAVYRALDSTGCSINQPLLTPNQAAERIGLSPRFLEARRHRGGGPRFVRVSARCIRYRPEDLDTWATERLATSTSDITAKGGDE